MAQSIHKGEPVSAIFFDLRKAFDVVDHERLLKSQIFLAGWNHIWQTESSLLCWGPYVR